MSFSCLSFVCLFVPFYAIPNTRSTVFCLFCFLNFVGIFYIVDTSAFVLKISRNLFRDQNMIYLQRLSFRDQNMMIHQLKTGIYNDHHVALHLDVVIAPRETLFLFCFVFCFVSFSFLVFFFNVNCKQMMSVKSKTVIMDCERIYFASTRTYA